MREVTFGDFSKLANKHGLTPEYLAERSTDKIERPSEFFHRLFHEPFPFSLFSAIVLACCSCP